MGYIIYTVIWCPLHYRSPYMQLSAIVFENVFTYIRFASKIYRATIGLFATLFNLHNLSGYERWRTLRVLVIYGT